jgi:hypothetical protein
MKKLLFMLSIFSLVNLLHASVPKFFCEPAGFTAGQTFAQKYAFLNLQINGKIKADGSAISIMLNENGDLDGAAKAYAKDFNDLHSQFECRFVAGKSLICTLTKAAKEQFNSLTPEEKKQRADTTVSFEALNKRTRQLLEDEKKHHAPPSPKSKKKVKK